MRSRGLFRTGENTSFSTSSTSTSRPSMAGHVVVDDPVDDGVQHGRGPALQDLRVAPPPARYVLEAGGLAVAHGHDEALAEEDQDLTELHDLLEST